jgi:uncharacterized protein involved in exopolysaccharide biosynthesis
MESPALVSPIPPPKRRWSMKRRLFVWSLIGLFAGVGAFALAPPRYRVQTTLLIIPQRVPEAMIPSVITASLGERLSAISQQILSRTRLQRIIKEFNLYESERRTMLLEDVIETMRQDIGVSIARPAGSQGVNSFSVSFEAREPRTAVRVTERLASLFVEENIEDRALLTEQVEQFLRGQIERTRTQLLQLGNGITKARREAAAEAVVRLLETERQVLEDEYKNLIVKAEAAQLAVSMERRQIGEQFKIIDAAELPERPASPTMPRYVVIGTIAGLAFGLVSPLLKFPGRSRHPAPSNGAA